MGASSRGRETRAARAGSRSRAGVPVAAAVLLWSLCIPPLAAGGPGYEAVVLADGPISYWRLGEAVAPTAVDATSTNDGTYGTNVTLGAAGALLSDSDPAIGLTGFASSKVTIPPAASLTPTVFTIELWARPTAAPGAGRSPATYRDVLTSSNISGWQLAVNPAGNWEFRTGRGNVGVGDAWNTIEGPSATPGQWAHLVGTYDGSDMRFFVDGALAGTLTSVAYLPVDSFFFFINFFIGASQTEDPSGTGGLFWIGDVDEVALYGHALSPSDVQAHYDAGTQPAGLTPGTITTVDKTDLQAIFHWDTEIGSSYQLRQSPDRAVWFDVGAPIAGTGGPVQRADVLATGNVLDFYRVEVTTP